MLVEGADAQSLAPLVSAQDVLSALYDRPVADHPIVRWARLLADVHRTNRPACGHDLVHEIDVWIELHVPQHRQGAALHTETLGSVIDRIVVAQARVTDALAAQECVDTIRVHAAWHRLAELVDSYNDLVREVLHGTRRLPSPAGEQ
ncbi:DUF4254 domain-containing protein [Nocardia colli]|uniref:DUF4254 domain-containing protein n=1 Tax=Nocardia colli TaxID=2545717 RepID=UPI00168D17CC|nr:DUF4254 domain-containing protein [Nocardia colli]